MNTQRLDHLDFLPEHFTEDDKIEYELLTADAKKIFPYMDDYVIQIGVIAHISDKKGLREPASKEEVEACMKRYDLNNGSNIVYITPYDPDFKMEDTLKEPIEMKVVSTGSNQDVPLLE